MQRFDFEMQIPAKTQEEAIHKANAIAALAMELSAEELEKLVHVIKHDPEKRALARKFLGIK